MAHWLSALAMLRQHMNFANASLDCRTPA